MKSLENTTNLTSYNKWLDSGEKLKNRLFEFDAAKKSSAFPILAVKEMHSTPKQFNSDYLEIGITDSNEKICIYTGDRKAKNGVFVFTDMLDEESCWYNQDGTPSESADREIIDRCGGGYQYGFDIVAKNFDAFLNISYLENCEQ